MAEMREQWATGGPHSSHDTNNKEHHDDEEEEGEGDNGEVYLDFALRWSRLHQLKFKSSQRPADQTRME